MEEVCSLLLMVTAGYLSYRSNVKVCKGDIIRVRRGIYWHYGIVLSDNQIIHYSSYPGHWWKKPASVRIVLWHQFLKKKKAYEIYYSAKSGSEGERIISRALQRIGEEKYSLLFNNCKQFVDDCRK